MKTSKFGSPGIASLPFNQDSFTKNVGNSVCSPGMSSFKIPTLSSNNINVILPNFTTRYGISATELVHFSSWLRPPLSRLNALGVVNSRPEDTRWVPSRDHYDTTQNMFTGWISNPFTGSLPLWEDGQPSFFRRRLRWCRYSCPLLELVASRVQQRLSSGLVPSSSMGPEQWVFTLYKIVMVGEYFPFGWIDLSTYH